MKICIIQLFCAKKYKKGKRGTQKVNLKKNHGHLCPFRPLFMGQKEHNARQNSALQALECPKKFSQNKLQTLDYILEKKIHVYDKKSLKYLKTFLEFFLSPHGISTESKHFSHPHSKKYKNKSTRKKNTNYNLKF